MLELKILETYFLISLFQIENYPISLLVKSNIVSEVSYFIASEDFKETATRVLSVLRIV